MTDKLARKTARSVDRRQFLVGSIAAGAGLTFGFSALPDITGSAGEARAAGNFSPTVWYTIDRGGIVTVQSGIGPRSDIERTSCRCRRREQRDLGPI